MTTLATRRITQEDHHRGVDVGPGMTQVRPVAYWYKGGYFATEAEARWAFKLAYQQGLDGMGASMSAWMGLTPEQYDAWMRHDALPPRNRIKA